MLVDGRKGLSTYLCPVLMSSWEGKLKLKRPRNSRNWNWKCQCGRKVWPIFPAFLSFNSVGVDSRINRVGLDKLYTAAAVYIRAMGKKKEGEDREKNLPVEILGSAMISHGGEYAPESAYGQALLKLGSGMERMSRFQEVLHLFWQSSFVRRMCTRLRNPR